MDDESGMMTEMSWEVDEEVNQDKNGEADRMNLEADSKDVIIVPSSNIRINDVRTANHVNCM